MRPGDPRPHEPSFALEAADTEREVLARRPRRAFLFLDVAFGVAVDDRQSLSCRKMRHELAVLAPTRLTQSDGCVTTKVGQPFPLFFAHVVVVRSPGSPDRPPPL